MTTPDLTPSSPNTKTGRAASELEARELGVVAGIAMGQPDAQVPTTEAKSTESAAEVQIRFEEFMQKLYLAKGEAFFDSAVATFEKLNAGDMHASHRSDSQEEVMRRYASLLTSQPDVAA